MSVLALDVGTSSTRAIVHDDAGAPVGEPVEIEWQPLPSGGGRVEFDLHRVAEAVDETVRGALRGQEVDAVAASCFWHSLALTDPRGEVVTPLLTWRDSRAEAEAEELARTLDAEDVHRRTGCPLHASFWPAKLLWLRRNDPWLARGAKAVSVSDVALGEPATSVSIASGTGMLNRETLDWDEELLAAVGIDPEQLPRVSDEPHERDGRTWLPAIGDGAAANLGSGAVGDGRRGPHDRHLGRPACRPRGRRGAAAGAVPVPARCAAGGRRRLDRGRRPPAEVALAHARPAERPGRGRDPGTRARLARPDVPRAPGRRPRARVVDPRSGRDRGAHGRDDGGGHPPCRARGRRLPLRGDPRPAPGGRAARRERRHAAQEPGAVPDPRRRARQAAGAPGRRGGVGPRRRRLRARTPRRRRPRPAARAGLRPEAGSRRDPRRGAGARPAAVRDPRRWERS